MRLILYRSTGACVLLQRRTVQETANMHQEFQGKREYEKQRTAICMRKRVFFCSRSFFLFVLIMVHKLIHSWCPRLSQKTCLVRAFRVDKVTMGYKPSVEHFLSLMLFSRPQIITFGDTMTPNLHLPPWTRKSRYTQTYKKALW